MRGYRVGVGGGWGEGYRVRSRWGGGVRGIG